MVSFRTIEISDPQFEAANLRFITVKSVPLHRRGDICVFVPTTGDAYTLPVVILLHGVYGSAWSWAYSGGIHLTAQQMITAGEMPPMIIAMPSDGLWGDGSGYLPHSGGDFERWIVEDVVAALIQAIPGARPESPLFIGGLSMGGFGALRIGAKYGARFSGISTHSAITHVDQLALFVEEDLANYRQPEAADEDVLQTIVNNRQSLPPLRFDCGAYDLLMPYNRRLHKALEKENIAHHYEEFPGAHEWPYWSTHVRKSLLFFASALHMRTANLK